jgi:patatin-like phospholipase/acyl hydrolase
MKFYKHVISLFSLSILLNFPILAFEPEESLSGEEQSFRIPSEAKISSFIEAEHLNFTVKGYEHGVTEIQPKIGLSIDGGGIRGLMPALWLQELNNQLSDHSLRNQPLYKIFDYVGGTSIGGYLALAVAAGLDPKIFTNLLATQAKDVFCPQKRKWFPFPNFYGLKGHQYGSENLEILLKNNFGEMTLNEAKTDVLVTACTTEGEPWLFKKEETKNYKLWEVARCTSAAPTYFTAFPLADTCYVDGGMWVNNPSTLVAASIVNEHQDGNFNPKKLHLLSLGTGEAPSSELPLSAGKIYAGAFIDVLMSSHSRGNHMLMKQFLGENYHRINPIMTQRIELDDISERAINSLTTYAGEETNKKLIGKFLGQIAEVVRQKLEASD